MNKEFIIELIVKVIHLNIFTHFFEVQIERSLICIDNSIYRK